MKKLRIAFLSDAQNTHTKRWVRALAEKGHEILLFSLTSADSFFDSFPNVKTISFGTDTNSGILGKLKYFSALPMLRASLKEFEPDIVNAHYASSYGALGSLSGFHPLVISVWGSDVYDFPNYAPFGKYLLRFVFKKADRILSTSHVMAKVTSKYTNKNILITPFGVDTLKFNKIEGLQPFDEFVVGNVKALTPKYGIDILIHAFKIVVERNPNLKTRLVIYGKGPNKKEYENLASSLGIGDKVMFNGFVDNDNLPEIYNSFSVSVSVSVSDSESFGVVAVEAMSCGCPVITSDADGFKEVVDNGKTGLIVPKKDCVSTADAIQKFIDNPSLRNSFGEAGRMRVLKYYDWEKNVEMMLNIYNQVIAEEKINI